MHGINAVFIRNNFLGKFSDFLFNFELIKFIENFGQILAKIEREEGWIQIAFIGGKVFSNHKTE